MTSPEFWAHGVDTAQLSIQRLGDARYDSPLTEVLARRRDSQNYVGEDDRVLLDDTARGVLARRNGTGGTGQLPGFEPGGPRRRIWFDPPGVRAGIVTCGGLCPGLNDVIRALVQELWQHYGVREILGFRNGYQGLVERLATEPMVLTPDVVKPINEYGGTILGASRGAQDPDEMVDYLSSLGVNMLFVVGGDGSMRGAQKISDAAKARGIELSVVGVPKTIDNDLPFIDQSFGFQTAFAKATESIRAARVEAQAAPGGVGLVKLMGRHSGFIAAYAALAKNDVDYVLIPEVPFALNGPNGLLDHVLRRVQERGYAVIVVAEGAGQEHFPSSDATDASGNTALQDIGRSLRSWLVERFAAADEPINVRYLDPSYAIRSVPADPYDAVYCIRLAHSAVHAAMAGRTAMVVGRWHGWFVHLPISLVTSRRNTVDPHGDLWQTVLEATGQPWEFS
ncbi:MAG: diphosphate--fructose-6-phosphate 1-phosphotransferase [Pseudonocardiales bacterium]|nr:diphosphate--fructose-6-phosphate 1-phosphotransferase [Pseudonocardiales bacterium]